MYSAREQQNNQRFDELAQTLHQFRNTVDNDIHGSIQQENSMIDMLGDNFSQLMTSVKRTSGDLRNVMTRNASLTRVVITILIAFVVIWTLYKLL
ncbi:hypothetical protein PGUG_05075 [Meyerozyma guilliermondii ATCC 6260]|uniref:t-SNARE coiled-coil homology domain-containing protein n=1 Tax=Meyerozyma guilliermondii (strain ATCC 6260 / CBS 566 / DSM 6381 / JCM 1539 / NBRC 10279 / NRRL Y-324) TaxID=294746 RepID=A5DP74_PICGU|nr:uncharacterized protein PGUG_05075 [Meyerozyma guilliermondii ATCC 6260]EDK40977.2 hypothetical protein PGUG_05075 [Meyerozyma guilliermondii ATCC 6260]RLV87712.1 hypothetical protein JA9_002622 [Meyerozyma sp. JA9]